VELAAAGWADVVDVHTRRGEPRVLAIPPVQTARTFYQIEARTPLRHDWLSLVNRSGEFATKGMALMWSLAPPPLIVGPDGMGRVRAHVLRLSPSTFALATPFVPGRKEDLFDHALHLDDASLPSLATPRGELFFELSHLSTEAADGGATSLTVRENAIELLRLRPSCSTRAAGGTFAPLPDDGIERGVGRVRRDPAAIGLAPRPGGAVRTEWEGARTAAGLRLLGTLSCAAREPAVVSIGSSGQTTFTARVDSEDNRTPFQADLPPGGPSDRVWIEVQAAAEQAAEVVLRDLVLVPRAQVEHDLLHGDAAAGAAAMRLTDGGLYAGTRMLRVAGREPTILESPIVLAPHPTALRLVVGRPFAAPAESRARLTVRLSHPAARLQRVLLADHELARGEGTAALEEILIALPDASLGKVAVVALEATGDDGAELALVAAEVARL
jgi:hypothetical protein